MTVGQTGAVIVGIVTVAAGIVSGHADAVVMGLPLLILAAWAWDRRPRAASGEQAMDAAPSAPTTVELIGDRTPRDGALGYRLRLDAAPGVEAVQLRVLELGVRPRVHVVASSPGRPVEFRGRVRTPHSGPQRVVAIEWRLVASGGAFLSDIDGPVSFDRTITPAFAPIGALPLPRRLTGMTGSHDSSRPGDGGDFHDIDRFRPGDRLRRIDWKTTARLARDPGELYVRRTRAQADATVFVIIDSADDVGENVDTWAVFNPVESGTTSLDVTRSAASSIAAGYLRQGDRVALTDLAVPGRVVRPGAGTRHLDRLLRSIAATAPSGAQRTTRRAPLVTPGAAVFLLSTFLDDHPAVAALQFAASGHRVIAVDVLPPARTDTLTTERRIAHRLIMMDRANRLTALARGGVELLPWGLDVIDAEREAMLLSLSRPRQQRAGAVR
ncbi:DUF58 domain-containing protein [Gryllotalpicola protaetiae]|uniref:DUF58 domain-containing protein n=1 Tax=Gryllotalpicola protaetiae TaxID=2419771 RepID=A0A387BS30_9MICO|nr:DUF58 domain-containing protein [Gryllotalpicola protaetiae]